MGQRTDSRRASTASLCSVLILIVGAAILTDCSRSESYAYTPPTARDSLSFQEISFLGHSTRQDVNNALALWIEESWFADILEQTFNVSLTFKAHGVRESDTAIWLSQRADDLADASFLYVKPPLGYRGGDAERLYEIGTTRSIPKEMIVQQMPGYTAYLNSRIEGGWESMGRASDDPDSFVSLISVDIYRAVPFAGVAVFADAAQAFGLVDHAPKEKSERIMEDPATYFVDTPIDVETWEGFLRYLKTSDPDGNGRNDTIPWPSPSTADDEWWSSGIRGITGRITGPMVVDGRITYGEISENFKAYCRLLQRWYAEGLIDLYFGTENWQRYVEKYSEGLMGASPVTTSGAFPLYANNESIRTCLLRAIASDHDAHDVLIFPPVQGETGAYGSGGGQAISGYRLVISHDVSDEKLERILQIWEFLNFSSDEDYIAARYGTPGKDFTWTGEPWKSRPKAISDRRQTKDGTHPTFGRIPILLPHGWDRRDLYLRFPTTYADLLIGKMSDQAVLGSAWFEDYLTSAGKGLLADAEREYASRLSRYAFTYLVDVVRNGRDIDGSWNNYVQSWLRMGGEQLISAATNDEHWQPTFSEFMPIY